MFFFFVCSFDGRRICAVPPKLKGSNDTSIESFNAMISRVTVTVVLLLLLFMPSSTPLTLPEFLDAVFVPIDPRYKIVNRSPIDSLNTCLCQCYNMTICFTVTYIGSTLTCILYFAQLDQGELQMVSSNVSASVFSFGNRDWNGKFVHAV